MRGKCLRESRVQDAELRTERVASGSSLEHSLLLRDHAVAAALTAGRRDRQHGTDRKRLLHERFAAIEIPEIAVVQNARGDRLGGVDRASAAHGEQEVHALLPAQINALVHKSAARIRLHAAELRVRDALLLQRRLHTVEQTRADHAAAAVVDQNLRSAEALHELARAVLLVLAKRKISWCVKIEIVHP